MQERELQVDRLTQQVNSQKHQLAQLFLQNEQMLSQIEQLQQQRGDSHEASGGAADGVESATAKAQALLQNLQAENQTLVGELEQANQAKERWFHAVREKNAELQRIEQQLMQIDAAGRRPVSLTTDMAIQTVQAITVPRGVQTLEEDKDVIETDKENMDSREKGSVLPTAAADRLKAKNTKLRKSVCQF